MKTFSIIDTLDNTIPPFNTLQESHLGTLILVICRLWVDQQRAEVIGSTGPCRLIFNEAVETPDGSCSSSAASFVGVGKAPPPPRSSVRLLRQASCYLEVTLVAVLHIHQSAVFFFSLLLYKELFLYTRCRKISKGMQRFSPFSSGGLSPQ